MKNELLVEFGVRVSLPWKTFILRVWILIYNSKLYTYS